MQNKNYYKGIRNIRRIKALVTKYGGNVSSIPDLRFLSTFFLGFAKFLRMKELLEVKLKREPLRRFNPKTKSRSS